MDVQVNPSGLFSLVRGETTHSFCCCLGRTLTGGETKTDMALTGTAGQHCKQSHVPDAVSRRRKAAPITEDKPLKKSARSLLRAAKTTVMFVF